MGTIERPSRYRGLHRAPQWSVSTWYSTLVLAILTLVKSRQGGLS